MRRGIAALLLTTCALSACSVRGGRGRAPVSAIQPVAGLTGTPWEGSPSDGPSVEDRVAALLEQMTLDEKIGQMTQVEKNSIQPRAVAQFFIGSVLSGGGGSPPTNTAGDWLEMVDAFQQAARSTRLGIPILYGVDAVHGHGNLYGASIFPHAIGLGATRDPDLVRRIGRATAEEMLATGAAWNFAPVIAVPQDVRWGRTYESFSEDLDLVSELGNAYLEGLQTLPDPLAAAPGQTLYVLATPKHFLGDGGTTFGTSAQFIDQPYLLDQGDMRLDESEVRRLFLPPYEAAVASGARSVMVSFSSWNGTKMHAQKYWITDVLKDELGFDGFVVSDWGGIDQISDDYYEAVVTAVNAGIDMNMVPYDYERFIEVMHQAVEEGDISEERIDDAVRRILRVKFELGLFDRPTGDPAVMASLGSDEHRELARQAVRQSLVLLSEADGVLPIAKRTPTIYVAGVGADDIGMQCGGWTIEWQGRLGAIQPGTTILEGIRSAVSTDTTVEYSPRGEFEGMAAVGIAVLGEQPYAEGVGDVENLSLSEADLRVLGKLRAHSVKVVAILLSGRPLIITDHLGLADAWIAAWLPGTEGGGVADILFGDYPFGGRLPHTWPRSNQQLPVNWANSQGLTGCAAPLFPLGYGLTVDEERSVEPMECP